MVESRSVYVARFLLFQKWEVNKISSIFFLKAIYVKEISEEFINLRI